MRNALKLIQRYKDIDAEIFKLESLARDLNIRVGYGYKYSAMEKLGKLEIYETLYHEQDDILESLGIGRYTENFGDDGTSEVVGMIDTVIRKFTVVDEQ